MSGEHPFLAATRIASESWGLTPDGRLQPRPEPGLLEARVSPRQFDRALAVVQEVIASAGGEGLQAVPIARGSGHRAGIAVGHTPVWIEERRSLKKVTEAALEEWRGEVGYWVEVRECFIRDRGLCPRANGRLRLRLPRRYDLASAPGWRHSFSDQDGRPLESIVPDVIEALAERVAT
jgi:hypothetical protein